MVWVICGVGETEVVPVVEMISPFPVVIVFIGLTVDELPSKVVSDEFADDVLVVRVEFLAYADQGINSKTPRISEQYNMRFMLVCC